jgi:spore germination cell wall hydrolase CwlJ-like protein
MIKILLLILVITLGYGSQVYGMNYELSDDEIHCLQKNAYFEGRNQGTAGIIAIVMVTINRVDSPRFPNNVCDVVYQSKKNINGRILKNKCQFSWYCDGKSDKIFDEVSWLDVRAEVYNALLLRKMSTDITEGSMWYHSIKVYPNWRTEMQFVTIIGDHIFYKEVSNNG